MDVDFPNNTAQVDMKPGATLTADAVNAKFQGTPYTVKTIAESP